MLSKLEFGFAVRANRLGLVGCKVEMEFGLHVYRGHGWLQMKTAGHRGSFQVKYPSWSILRCDPVEPQRPPAIARLGRTVRYRGQRTG